MDSDDPAPQATALQHPAFGTPDPSRTVRLRGPAAATPASTLSLDAPVREGAGDSAFTTNWAETSRYALVSELARGGGGRIAVAIDRKLGRRVALKRALDETGDERLEREALVLARLEHPAIVPIHDVGHDTTGAPYYTMKLVGGATLATKIDEAVTLERRLGLLAAVTSVADAIAYAHSQRVIHRDLKPGNVLVGAFGEVAVIDWGLGKHLDDADAEVTASSAAVTATPLTVHGAVMGTPAYMAPEQALGKPADERADVYAIGAILYHLLSGDIPYGKLDSQNTLLKLIEGAPPRIEEREPRVPRELAAIVNKATARQPDARYPTAKELAEDLHRYQTGRLVDAHRYSWLGRALRWCRRHKALLATTTAVGATAIAVILYVLFGRADTSLRAAQQHVRETDDALHQTEAQRAEAQRRAAETEAERAKAELQVHAKSAEVEESREQLQAKNAKLEETLREANAARERADRASAAAEKAARDAREANAQLQQALDRERARVKELEDKKKKLSTTLD